MQFMGYYYLNAGKAIDLGGRDKKVYRFLEFLPGIFTWLTLIFIFLASKFIPVFVAFFIIIFDVYWLFKTIYLFAHLRANWTRIRHYLEINWIERLKNLKYDHVWQMVFLPFYKEEEDIIDGTIKSLLNSVWDKKKMIIVLAYEERAGEEAEKIANKIFEKYKSSFGYFLTTKHPQNLSGELAGKGSNCAYAAQEAKRKILDKNKIEYEDVLVSNFDIDTRVYPQYFLCLTWHFLTSENPYHSSFQPIPVYNNNIWEAPAFSRVVAASATFWQMIEQERPEQLVTFSSHSMTLKSLNEIGLWQKNVVSEDSRVFWHSFLFFNGDYRVVPVAYPVSMDANLGNNFWQTIKNVYKQQRRWAWGTAENAVYLLFGCLKNKKIPLKKKFQQLFIQFEGGWSAATNPLIIFFLGWLPLLLGGEAFNRTLLSYNLPRITRDIMTLAMAGLILSAAVSMSLLPPWPKGKKWYYKIFMLLQWILTPITIPIFGSIPNIEAQTRLMFGKYMGFWVTPKHRKRKENKV
jgi:cellulose synthase/poly-beta-1,6-N-acetylglucosamine synthase-like glycosyltransferase